MRRNLILSTCMLLLFIYIQGCATAPQSIPASYMQKQHQLSVQVSEIREANFRDSGGGGIVGVLVGIGRSSNMKDMFEGIKSDTVKELLRQEIEKKLEDSFTIDEESKDLALEVSITQWGWFLPTTAFGIKTGSYQLEIMGFVTVNEMAPEKKEIARLHVISQKPLGNEPTTDMTQQALKQAVEDFAEKTRETLLQEKKG